MRKIFGVILFGLVLAGCTNTVEDNQLMEQPEDQEATENPETSKEVEPEEKPIEEEEAVAISKDLVAKFYKLLFELGEKNGWDFEHPADYDMAKPELLTVATEEFADQELKEYLKEYYCNCDSVWGIRMDEQVIRIKTERQVDRFTISGMVLPSFVSSGEQVTMDFRKEEDGWKMDGWGHEPLAGKDLNLTKEEVQQAFPEYHVIGEETMEDGTPIVKMESDMEVIGVSIQDGTIHWLNEK